MRNKKWGNLEYKLNIPSTLTKNILSLYINNFWKEIMESINDNQHVMLMFRVKFTNNQIVSISTLKKVNKTSKDLYLNYLLDKLSLSNESYNVEPVSSIIFSYGIRKVPLHQI